MTRPKGKAEQETVEDAEHRISKLEPAPLMLTGGDKGARRPESRRTVSVAPLSRTKVEED